jgi:hypothetical protein
VLSQVDCRPPEGVELHKRSAEANDFDGDARLGRTGHKERTPCWRDPCAERTMTDEIGSALPVSFRAQR